MTYLRVEHESTKFHNGEQVVISTTLRSEPSLSGTSVLLRANQFFFFLPASTGLSMGDRISVQGTLNENKLENVTLLSHHTSQNPLYKLRSNFIENISKSLPPAHAALVSGITLGSKSGISESLRDKLIESGTIHTVVASGTNVALFGGFVLSLAVNFTRRKQAVLLTIVSIWFYTLLSGFDPPLVRAAIMGSLAFSAQALGRLSSALNALTIAVVAMLLFNPFWLIELSFIMSFLATLGLILLQPAVSTKLPPLPNLIKEGLSTSLAAQIPLTPVLIYFFGSLNLLSPLVNSLILWAIVPIMIIGGLGALVGLIYFPFAKIILLTTYPLTLWFLFVVNLFS